LNGTGRSRLVCYESAGEIFNMFYLYVLLVLSLLAVLVALCAMWWRLRLHLRHADQPLKATLEEIDPQPKGAAGRSSR
jgi:uncharacterized membrane protein YqjE